MSKGVIIMNGFGTRNGRGGTISVTVFISASRRSVEKSSVRLLGIEYGFLNRRNFRENNFEKLPREVTREDKERFTDDSERTERKGKRKSKSIAYSVGVLIGIAQNVLI